MTPTEFFLQSLFWCCIVADFVLSICLVGEVRYILHRRSVNRSYTGCLATAAASVATTTQHTVQQEEYKQSEQQSTLVNTTFESVVESSRTSLPTAPPLEEQKQETASIQASSSWSTTTGTEDSPVFFDAFAHTSSSSSSPLNIPTPTPCVPQPVRHFSSTYNFNTEAKDKRARRRLS